WIAEIVTHGQGPPDPARVAQDQGPLTLVKAITSTPGAWSGARVRLDVRHACPRDRAVVQQDRPEHTDEHDRDEDAPVVEVRTAQGREHHDEHEHLDVLD